MSRSKQTQTGATPAPATQPTPALDINALRAQRKALSDQIKAAKAQTDGKITAIEYAPADAEHPKAQVLVDVECGDGSRRTEKGAAYLFSCDGFEFSTPDGRKWRTGAFYATEVKA